MPSDPPTPRAVSLSARPGCGDRPLPVETSWRWDQLAPQGFLLTASLCSQIHKHITSTTATRRFHYVGQRWELCFLSAEELRFVAFLVLEFMLTSRNHHVVIMWLYIFWLTGHQSNHPEDSRPAASSQSGFQSGKHCFRWSHGKSLPVSHLFNRSVNLKQIKVS